VRAPNTIAINIVTPVAQQSRSEMRGLGFHAQNDISGKLDSSNLADCGARFIKVISAVEHADEKPCQSSFDIGVQNTQLRMSKMSSNADDGDERDPDWLRDARGTNAEERKCNQQNDPRIKRGKFPRCCACRQKHDSEIDVGNVE